MRDALTVFTVFLRLGCYAFGGPVAHLSYFRRECVQRRRWLDEPTFAACIALTQMLPGPGSSQVGMLIGWARAGFRGAVAAWVGFTLPAAVLMTAIAELSAISPFSIRWTHGLLAVAAAVVASAIVSMRRSLVTDVPRALLAFGVLLASLFFPSPWTPPLCIVLAALLGTAFVRTTSGATARIGIVVPPVVARIAAMLFLVSLVIAPLIAAHARASLLGLTGQLYVIGSLVFGGGHVVLPLLQSSVVSSGAATSSQVLTGYAAVQAMPGPLFSIAAYVGAVAHGGRFGAIGALAGICAIYAPSFLLLLATLPLYSRMASDVRFRSAIAGANAGVVGLLAATFITPIASSALRTPVDLALAVAAFVALHVGRVPPWAVVAGGALAGFIIR